jgi:hypothetical protein
MSEDEAVDLLVEVLESGRDAIAQHRLEPEASDGRTDGAYS